ncbi:MAG: methyltransferase domain-containing protein [Amphritea sp.]|nr:methyltransferase domain-containing protein [Amphritea sp.]
MSIENHYSDQLQTPLILERLQEAYPDGPTPFQLAPIDQLHIGGIKASQKLLQRLEDLQPRRILEIGSGMGGLMRLTSDTLDAEIVGIDITHGFNHLNHQLSRVVNQPEAAILTTDAQHLPFADNSFDCILFQHSLLNIPDTQQCLAECQRVLTDNGSLLMHEVFSGNHPERMLYPVPWARDPQHSHLISIEAFEALIQESDFTIQSQQNWSDEALAWRKRQAEKESAQSVNDKKPAPISPALLLGKDFKDMGPNVMRNLSNDAVQVWEILLSSNL